jgi:hypothetical protein
LLLLVEGGEENLALLLFKSVGVEGLGDAEEMSKMIGEGREGVGDAC